jgi:hypothetical protein
MQNRPVVVIMMKPHAGRERTTQCDLGHIPSQAWSGYHTSNALTSIAADTRELEE